MPATARPNSFKTVATGFKGKYSAKFLGNNLCANFYRPNNLSTLITFDAGGVWSPIAGPTTDHDGHPILGCSQVSTLPAVLEVSVGDQYSD
jgi:hypothetical protein